MKQFAKALQHEKSCFQYLKSKFPKISNAKIKEGKIGPQIHQLMAGKDFEMTLDENEQATWHAFKGICCGVLGKHPEGQHKHLGIT